MASILPRPTTATPTTDAPDGSLPVDQLRTLLAATLTGDNLTLALQLLDAVSESVSGTTSSVVEGPGDRPAAGMGGDRAPWWMPPLHDAAAAALPNDGQPRVPRLDHLPPPLDAHRPEAFAKRAGPSAKLA